MLWKINNCAKILIGDDKVSNHFIENSSVVVLLLFLFIVIIPLSNENFIGIPVLLSALIPRPLI